MAVRLRLQRHGARHAPVYRIVAADSRAPRDGKFIEILGTYTPKARIKENHLRLHIDRVDYWLGVGAKPSDTVRTLVNYARREGIGAPTEAERAAKAEAEKPAEAEEAPRAQAKAEEAAPAAAAEEVQASAEAEETPATDAEPATEEEK